MLGQFCKFVGNLLALKDLSFSDSSRYMSDSYSVKSTSGPMVSLNVLEISEM